MPIALPRRRLAYPFPVPDVVDFFAVHFGPLVRTNEALGDEDRAALRRDLVEVFGRFDRGTDGTVLMEGEFLSVQAVR